MELNEIISLGKALAVATPSSKVAYSYNNENYSYNDLQDTFRDALMELGGTYALFRKNKNDIYTIMEQIIDEAIPKRVIEAYGTFANIKTFNQGEKPVFVQKISAASKMRAKRFITKVGLAGVYEVFRLDGRSIEVPTTAYGGAAQIGIEEFLDGKINMADVLDILLEGLDEAVYLEIEKALIASVANLPRANKSTSNAFNEGEFDKLLSIADAYGGRSTIYCTFEFAATMMPAAGYSAWSDNMKDQHFNNGYFTKYKGHDVAVLPQSYTDSTNEHKVIDPSYAWILPTGANDKPVCIALEGSTIMRDVENADFSREVQAYKKIGVGILASSDICVYKNTSLVKDYEEPTSI